jgi:hypothetical protein
VLLAKPFWLQAMDFLLCDNIFLKKYKNFQVQNLKLMTELVHPYKSIPKHNWKEPKAESLFINFYCMLGKCMLGKHSTTELHSSVVGLMNNFSV